MNDFILVTTLNPLRGGAGAVILVFNSHSLPSFLVCWVEKNLCHLYYYYMSLFVLLMLIKIGKREMVGNHLTGVN